MEQRWRAVKKQQVLQEAAVSYIMHGIASDLTTGKEVKSSAEFEGQFKRYSTMTIVQDANLYTPNKNNTPATLSANPSVARSVSKYYTTTKSISSNTHRTPVVLDDNVNTFNFRNGINPSNITQGDATNYPDTGTHIESAVQMTELFTNTVNTGTLIVKKVVSGQSAPADSTEYTFKLQLKNVFGVANNDVDNYSSIAVTKTAAGSSTSSVTLGADGTFKLKKGEQISISGVPVGTRYIVTETGANNATVTGEVKLDDAEQTIAEKNGKELCGNYSVILQ